MHIQSEQRSCEVSDSLDRILFIKPPISVTEGNRRNILDFHENMCLFLMPHVHVVGLGWKDRQGPNYVKPCGRK